MDYKNNKVETFYFNQIPLKKELETIKLCKTDCNNEVIMVKVRGFFKNEY